MEEKIKKTDAEWKAELTPEQYRVLREKGTERAFTGKYNIHKEKGMYVCAGCNSPLFSSDTKFDSGCGWPSFYEAIDTEKIKEVRDISFGMIRTEIICAKCDGHLGHVFDDGPKPTGLRYCVNSLSIDFKKSS
ncbi:MAG: Peptide methionine sulfoxide reductase MsrB [Bacteroidia bacterium]|nr:Peptide methionine sulfoxide reductase MsrB [Bacteroidia bacterium]